MKASEIVEQLHSRANSELQGADVVTGNEVEGWPDGVLDKLVREGMLVATQPAETAMCTACFEDHVEPVQYVEEPPGSALRAYIACPEVGRVAVDTERMRRWQIVPTAMPKPEEDAGPDIGRTAGPERVAHWPPTAAAFFGVLYKASGVGAQALRWEEIRGRLNALGHYPHRARDVRRNVPDWDEVVVSPRKGFYTLKP